MIAKCIINFDCNSMLYHSIIFIITLSTTMAQHSDSFLFKEILQNLNPEFHEIISAPKRYKLQIIYTQVNRNTQNIPELKTHSYMYRPGEYFYPASTVKLPIAAIALEKLNSIENVDMHSHLNILSDMPGIESVLVDKTSKTGIPTIAHYVHKLFVVSDNDASNRLFDFLGLEYLNQRLWDLGYTGARIRHRYDNSLNGKQNHYSSAFRFFDGTDLIYKQPSKNTSIDLDINYDNHLVGKSYLENGNRIEQPFDFSRKNFMNLMEQHNFLIQIMFPELVSDDKRLNLTYDDYNFLYQKMSLLPRESKYPVYSDDQYYDSYGKFFLFGDTRNRIPDHIQIFNKVGFAYGFMLDNAYIIDVNNGLEFFLSAVIYVNQNDTLNDNIYEYDEISIPFLSDLGRVIYTYELNRTKNIKPDLTRLNLDSN
ncbi:MAG: hypothetical protein CMG74_12290 [Candidatus Marinimicrobia bacterium]|nr:hypothetical protein [Candidatus Neomarinimicrobiota bacterium]